MAETKPLSVAAQRKRRENCKECGGEGWIPGHTPMKICDCIERTDHSRYPHSAPAGTKANTWGMPVATPVKEAVRAGRETTARVPKTKAKEDRDLQNARSYGFNPES